MRLSAYLYVSLLLVIALVGLFVYGLWWAAWGSILVVGIGGRFLTRHESEAHPVRMISSLVFLLLIIALIGWVLVQVPPGIFLPVVVSTVVGCGGILLAISYWRRSTIDPTTAGRLCEKCGYDLKESYDRCPECGGPIPTDLARRRRLKQALSKPPADSSNTGAA